jgi:hypothetical protein
MIEKIKEQYKLLKLFKKISKNSSNNKIKQDKLIDKWYFNLGCLFSISSTLLFLFFFNGNPMDIPFFIFFIIMIYIAAFLSLRGISFLLNKLYKLKNCKKYSTIIKTLIPELSSFVFIKKYKIAKYENIINKLDNELMELINNYNIKNMNNKELITLLLNKQLESNSIEYLIINLNTYFKYIKNTKDITTHSKEIFYSVFLNKILTNLDYKIFNKYKVEIINTIELNFNEYQQIEYFEKLNSIKEEFDSNIIKENINAYKKNLLNDNKILNNKNKLLKII